MYILGLLDPKWIEERNRQIQERTDQEEVFAAGSSIESSLKHLAERRTDIFGAGTEEAGIGKKVWTFFFSSGSASIGIIACKASKFYHKKKWKNNFF